jgi:hypothetical protein
MQYVLTALAAWLLLAAPAFAIGAAAVEDASIADFGTYEVESFGRMMADGWQQWIQPASQVAPGVQLAVGTAQGGGALFGQSVAIQGKTLFKALEPGGIGYGLAVNAGLGASGLEGLSANVPVSQMLFGEQVLLHENIGWAFDPVEGHTMTWGLASEFQISDRVSGLTELYGDVRSAPTVQAGLNYWVAPETWQMSGTYNYRLDGRDAFVTLGVGYYGGLFSSAP